MADKIELYNQDYGQRLRINTWCEDITDSTAQTVRFKRETTGETYELVAAIVPVAQLTKAAKRSIVCTIPSNWLKDKLGLWAVAAQITWGDATVSGKPIVLKVLRHPTKTTTTTSTTTTSTTSTPP